MRVRTRLTAALAATALAAGLMAVATSPAGAADAGCTPPVGATSANVSAIDARAARRPARRVVGREVDTAFPSSGGIGTC